MRNIKLVQTPTFMPENVENNVLDCILGEVLWHSLTLDPTILKESDAHFENLCPIIDDLKAEIGSDRPLRILELAAYSHVTGYRVAQTYNAEVILADISPDTLTKGYKIAKEIYGEDIGSRVHRWAIDFHELPFPDGSFDLVYIASAVHHTWEWQKVIQEMQRVTGKGGIIYLFNEPCFREFCFYKFRTNRMDAFCEFEKKLEDCGLLRTIAEPYWGSRAEALFGMIENQTIVFDSLIGELETSCKLLKLEVSPEICMGEWEHLLLTKRLNGQEAIEEEIRNTLESKLKNIKIGAMELSMGMSLPSSKEIFVFSKKLSKKIMATTVTKTSEELRVELVKIFGGSVNVLVKKDRGVNSDKSVLLAGKSDIINMSYPKSISRILNNSKDLFIDSQTSSDDTLSSHFKNTEWVKGQNDAGQFSFMSIINNQASLSIASNNESLALILIRMSLRYDDTPYKFQMLFDGSVVSEYEVYKSDTILIRNELNISKQENIRLEFRAVGMDENSPCEKKMGMALCAIRIIALKKESFKALKKESFKLSLLQRSINFFKKTLQNEKSRKH